MTQHEQQRDPTEQHPGGELDAAERDSTGPYPADRDTAGEDVSAQAVAGPEAPEVPARRERHPVEQVEQPAKVMRVASMIKQLLEEVRAAPLDEAGRQRLAEIHRRSLTELEKGLSEELVEELERITLPFGDQLPSEAELRIAQAQLVGWLEGLFHGIQTAIVAQQMAAQSQLQQMRRALPGGPPGGIPGQHPPPAHPGPEDHRTGQYL